VQVIQQIRAEVNDQVRVVAEPVYVPSQETRSSRLRAPEATALGRSALGSTPSTSRSRSLRSSAVRAAESTARRAGGAEDRLSKLVRRLQDLIHLAEDQNRLAEARGQVRLAEDSADARAEGQAQAQGAGPNADAESHDIEALGREVLDAVSKELELRRSRRMEDGDESPWWW
jgi:TolA-binding protein